jgi:succinyl-CoA synthetase alpha subunit
VERQATTPGHGPKESDDRLAVEASHGLVLERQVDRGVGERPDVRRRHHEGLARGHRRRPDPDHRVGIVQGGPERRAEGAADRRRHPVRVRARLGVHLEPEVERGRSSKVGHEALKGRHATGHVAARTSVQSEDDMDPQAVAVMVDLGEPNVRRTLGHRDQCSRDGPNPDRRPVSFAAMAILVGKDTRVIVAGMTGREGTFHTQQMIEYGTQVVGGVTPGKGGTRHLDRPVFDTMAEAVAQTGANAVLIFVPAPFAADSVLEAEAAGVPFVCLITEGVPIQDMVRVVAKLRSGGRTRLLGGNCAGIITPGECKMGIMPGHIFTPGPVGMVSRSGTLTYEIVWELTRAGLGQTTCVGVGGDPVPGTRFIEALQMFEADPATRAVVMVGEIGGTDEEAGAAFIKTMSKPVVGFISGRTAPPGKRMGHAGAIVSGGLGTAQSKVDALLAAGAQVADKTSDVPGLIGAAMAARV